MLQCLYIQNSAQKTSEINKNTLSPHSNYLTPLWRNKKKKSSYHFITDELCVFGLYEYAVVIQKMNVISGSACLLRGQNLPAQTGCEHSYETVSHSQCSVCVCLQAHSYVQTQTLRLKPSLTILYKHKSSVGTKHHFCSILTSRPLR